MKKILRRGQIIFDEKGNKYLIVRINEKSVECFNEKWSRVDIGLSFIKYFFFNDNEEDIDLESVIDFLKENKEE